MTSFQFFAAFFHIFYQQFFQKLLFSLVHTFLTVHTAQVHIAMNKSIFVIFIFQFSLFFQYIAPKGDEPLFVGSSSTSSSNSSLDDAAKAKTTTSARSNRTAAAATRSRSRRWCICVSLAILVLGIFAAAGIYFGCKLRCHEIFHIGIGLSFKKTGDSVTKFFISGFSHSFRSGQPLTLHGIGIFAAASICFVCKSYSVTRFSITEFCCTLTSQPNISQHWHLYCGGLNNNNKPRLSRGFSNFFLASFVCGGICFWGQIFDD